MAEGHLSGMGDAAPSDECRLGNRVVGAPERPFHHNAVVAFQKAGDAVDLGHFQGFFLGHGRQDGRQPPGQHGLPGSGSPHHQHIVASRRSDLQGPLGHFLALDICKVHGILQGFLQFQHLFGQRLQRLLSLEMVHDLPQVVRGIHLDPVHQFPFGSVAGRDENGRQPFVPGPEDHGQDPVHRAQGSVQGQLSGEHRHGVRQFHILLGSQHPQGNGQIQSGPILFQVRRSQIHSYVGVREPEAGILHRSLHPLPGLLHCRIRQPHHFKGRHAVGHIHLHCNHFSVDPAGGLPPGPCVHGISSFVVYRESFIVCRLP